MSPGERKFRVWAAFGNFQSSLEAEPEFGGEIRAGQVYQLHGRLYEDSNGDPLVKLWFEHLGSVGQYEAFKERNPDQPGGRPLGKRQMTSR